MNLEIKEMVREDSKIGWPPTQSHSFQWNCNIPLRPNISIIIIIIMDKDSHFRNTERKKRKGEKRKGKGNTHTHTPQPFPNATTVGWKLLAKSN